MTVAAIVQARMGSTRLPGKVMRPLAGRPLIEVLLDRLARAVKVDEIVLATTMDRRDDVLADYVARLGYRVVRGPEDDVLERFRLAAESVAADVLVRITGDCPLVDPALVDATVDCLRATGAAYVTNFEPRHFPDGLDVEAMTRDALLRAAAEATDRFDREHVTPWLRAPGRVKTASYAWPEDHGAKRWTVDEAADLRVMQRVFDRFAPDIHMGWEDVLALQVAEPALFADNARIGVNEGADMGTGQKLWKRAKTLIPGGNMLLSKRAEMFLPEGWPAYFSSAKGCTVWDLDGREYCDMGLMGVGTNTLGYGHPEVDAAVMETVQAGNMSSLNAPEEVALAERLVALHPWAEMVRFARTGGEANAVAVRIARAASGRDGVAICGYHGWHDWYLASNLGNERGLDGHLLPGLEPNGVPRALRGTVHPFAYNDLGALEGLLREREIGVIKMEVSRNAGPAEGFLQAVRGLADAHGAVLVFDECTSGFRETFGGLHLKYGVTPDIALFGKALGNGYAVTAALGRASVMEAAQTSFISSTFWTERIGSAAALRTLEVMERERSWERITQTGLLLRAGWEGLAATEGLAISVSGLPALSTMSFQVSDPLAAKTYMTQAMLDRGWLATTAFYASLAHADAVLEAYLTDLAPVFRTIAEAERAGRPLTELLRGPVAHAGFKRLN